MKKSCRGSGRTWLNDAINKLARALADREDAQAFQLLQQQIVSVGQRRVELQMEIAQLARSVEGTAARA